jgi:DNA modification methylase
MAATGAAARLSRGFLGSSVDLGDVSFQMETWRAIWQALKPGGRLLAFGGTRSWWKLAAAIEAGGFEIEDTLMWVYGSGQVMRRSRLKPSYEPILLARKNAKGMPVQDLGLDACRGPEGKWPGNLLIDDDVASADEHRLFYCPKANASERVFLCEVCGAIFRGGREDLHGHGMEDETHIVRHPAVKPQALLQWLTRLVTRPGELVLDPFCGSGSGVEAALAEGRSAVGIELDPVHASIARGRFVVPATPG